MKSWAASVTLHGAAAAMAAMFWADRIVEPKPEALRWTVAFAQPRQTPPAPTPAEQAPPPKTPPQQARRPPPPPAAPARESAEPAIQMAEMPPAAAAQAAPESPPPAPPRQDVAPAPAQAHAADEIERRWYLALLEQLRALKRYPLAARRLGQEGVVLIEARIGADGQLENMAVKQGSGYPMLDRSALELFESAAARARGQLRPERPTRLEIPIAYKLES